MGPYFLLARAKFLESVGDPVYVTMHYCIYLCNLIIYMCEIAYILGRDMVLQVQ